MGKISKRYFWHGFLVAFLGMPLLVQAVLWGMILLTQVHRLVSTAGAIGLFFVCAFFLWNRVARREDLPGEAFFRYLPIGAALVWYLTVFVVGLGLSGYDFGGGTLIWMQFVLAMPWFLVTFLLGFAGGLEFFPYLLLILYGVTTLVFLISCLRFGRRAVRKTGGLALVGAVLLLCGVMGFQYHQQSLRFLGQYYEDVGADYTVARIEEEVDLFDYQPFRVGNRLVVPGSSPSLSISSDYPVMDGATAAYPVYAAMAQAVYKGLDEQSVREIVTCNTTPQGYQRLINGEVDLFVGAGPSEAQLLAAEEAGVTLHLTPIAREAFVFLVHEDNPVDGLTVAQIQGIYNKQLTNWQQVGGLRERIVPFQRPRNSGSQTIMEQVMEGYSLADPLMEEVAEGMGGVMHAVASYRNYTGSIGYSFRYFATGMNPVGGVKLLAVDGAAPTVENIREGRYPFTVEVYAVTLGEPKGNTKALVEWMRSDEGQELIELCDYVGIAK